MHKAGKLRILAISSAEPVAALPGVPTFKAAGYPELGVAELFGFFARAGTPAATVAQLNAAITAAVKSPAVVEALQKLEFEPRTMSSDDLGKFIKSEHARWGEIVQATGYTPEE
jgi:tripartite-type tricarboxylate transporter receptor subunit TctC